MLSPRRRKADEAALDGETLETKLSKRQRAEEKDARPTTAAVAVDPAHPATEEIYYAGSTEGEASAVRDLLLPELKENAALLLGDDDRQ